MAGLSTKILTIKPNPTQPHPAIDPMKQPTSDQIAASFELWQEYIDPMASIDFEEFLALTHSERLALIVQTFPPSQLIP